LAEFAKTSKSPGPFTELEALINREIGKTGLMLFLELDHGAVLRKEMGLDKPKIVRLVIGNPLVMKEMAKHIPDAGSYAPVTVLVDERSDGVHLSLRQDDQLSGSVRKLGRIESCPGFGPES
jgi:uncharacterized protein (DUF302 family)